MKRLRQWMFYAMVGSFLTTFLWMCIGMAIAFSVPSLREARDMPLWYILPIVYGLALTAVVIFVDSVLWLIERKGRT